MLTRFKNCKILSLVFNFVLILLPLTKDRYFAARVQCFTYFPMHVYYVDYVCCVVPVDGDTMYSGCRLQ